MRPTDRDDVRSGGTGNFQQGTYGADRYQTIYVSDLISEGPIQGLVDADASVFLNNVRVKNKNQAGSNQSLTTGELTSVTGAKITLSSSVTGTISPASAAVRPPIENSGVKYLIIRNVTSISAVEFSNIEVANSEYSSRQAISSTASLKGYISPEPFTPNSIPLRSIVDGETVEFFVAEDLGADGVLLVTTSPIVLQGTHNVYVDQFVEITEYNEGGLDLVFASAVATPSGSFAFDVTSAIQKDAANENPNADAGNSQNNNTNYKDISVQFRTGNLNQAPLTEIGGVGNTSFTATVASPNLNQIPNSGTGTPPIVHNYGYDSQSEGAVDGVPVEILGSDILASGTSSYRVSELDEVRVLINYNSLVTYDDKGKTKQNYAFYYVDITPKRLGGDFEDYEPRILYGAAPLVHSASSTSPVTFEVNINLEELKPFTDFKIRIARLTSDVNGNTGTSSTGNPNEDDNYRGSSQARVSQVVGIIKDKFTYPFTAYSGITFSSEEFQNVPSRSYECKGLKIKVPSNYVTRDESPTGIASYTRDVSTREVTGTYQDWDGEFRSGVYTNNPAWVFYDILSNNRYGLGTWVEESEIDKYALYRISKYCDELVPDGRGGLEPRFTCNLYLNGATEAYKVLKDMSSIFRGVLFWLDGSLTTLIDQPLSPVASFSPANVEAGAFSYTGTGSKARPNQIIVNWNNPDANYRLEPIIVEDREDILKTGRIISEDTLAMGCTSEGQAHRYGRWKLWTSKNQTEVVSFKTAMAGSVVFPGDVILISDTNRYVKPEENNNNFNPTRYAGRTIATSDGTSVDLDRSVDLAADFSYTLSIYVAEPSAILSQTSATIAGTTYKSGDYLQTLADGVTLIDSEDKASNVIDDSGSLVQIVWNKYSRVETRKVAKDNSASIVTSTLSIGEGGFLTNTIPPNTIWILNGFSINEGNSEIQTSGKEYKVISVSQEQANVYTINAIEHYNEKFDSIDKNLNLELPDQVLPPEPTGGDVPVPRSVSILNTQDPKEVGNEFTLQWLPPRNINNDEEGIYEYLAGYEISHNIPEYSSPINVVAGVTSYRFSGVSDGVYTLGVRTLSQGKNKSSYKFVKGDIRDPFERSVPRLLGIAKGATISTPLGLDSTTQFLQFEKPPYAIRPIQLSTGRKISTEGTTAQEKEPVGQFNNPLSSAVKDDGTSRSLVQLENSAFLYYSPKDFNSDPYKLVAPTYSTFSVGTPFWYDLGNGMLKPEDGGQLLSGVVTGTKDSNILEGINTQFLSELKVGDIVYFGSLSDDQPAKVSYIRSDTFLFLDRNLQNNITEQPFNKIGFVPDFYNDCLLGRLYYDDVLDQRQFDSYCIVDPRFGESIRSATLSSTVGFLAYFTDGSASTHPSSITLTATAQGYTNPVFRINGGGFTSFPNASPDNTFTGTQTSTYTKTLNGPFPKSGNGNQFQFDLTISESSDPLNPDFQTTDTVYIGVIINGQDGSDGNDGEAPPPANDGEAGAQSFTNYLYYYQLLAEDASPPQGIQNPGQALFNFTTGQLTLSNTDSSFWKDDPIPQEPGEVSTQYYVKYYVYQDSSGQTVTFQSPVKGSSFTGAVTFIDLAGGGNPTTVIDGGLILTDTIEANKIKIDGLTLDTITDSEGKQVLTIGGQAISTQYLKDDAVTTAKVSEGAISAVEAAQFPTKNNSIQNVSNTGGSFTNGAIVESIQIDWGTNSSSDWPKDVVVIYSLNLLADAAKRYDQIQFGISRSQNSNGTWNVVGLNGISGGDDQRGLSRSITGTSVFGRPTRRVETYYLMTRVLKGSNFGESLFKQGTSSLFILGLKR